MSVRWAVASSAACLVAFLLFKKYSVSEQEVRGALVAEKLSSRGRLIESLTSHETMLCADLVFPEDLTVGFQDVAGLESVKQGLLDVMKLFQNSTAETSSKSKLRVPPKGILLYGPPGNGKTMIACAMAKEMKNCSFLPIQASTLFQKYYGESEKMAQAVFGLARKIAPCVVFMDEIDMLVHRDDSFAGPTNKVLGILLSAWDGITNNDGVIVVGSTNNPKNIDVAMHRRLPRQFYLGPPDLEMRFAILKKVLEEESVDDKLIRRVAAATDRYCGSDLLELCKVAVVNRVREGEETVFAWQHFDEAMKCVRYAGASADEQMQQEMDEQVSKFARVVKNSSRK